MTRGIAPGQEASPSSGRTGKGPGLRGVQGSSLVEFAMVGLILCTVVFGVMAIGLALYSSNVVSEAAREGTRYAIVRGSSCTDFPSACPAQVSDIENFVEHLPFPGIIPSNLTAVASFSPFTAGATCSPSALCNNPGNVVQVTVQYSFTIPFVPARIFNMSSTSAMVISQ